MFWFSFLGKVLFLSVKLNLIFVWLYCNDVLVESILRLFLSEVLFSVLWLYIIGNRIFFVLFSCSRLLFSCKLLFWYKCEFDINFLKFWFNVVCCLVLCICLNILCICLWCCKNIKNIVINNNIINIVYIYVKVLFL